MDGQFVSWGITIKRIATAWVTLMTCLYALSCSESLEKKQAFSIRVTNLDGSPVESVVAGRQYEWLVWVKDLESDQLEEINVEIRPDQCLRTSDDRFQLIGDEHFRENGEFARPFTLNVPVNCAGEGHSTLLIGVSSEHGERRRVSNWTRDFQINKVEHTPRLKIANLLLNGIPRHSVFQNEVLDFSFELLNTGDEVLNGETLLVQLTGMSGNSAGNSGGSHFEISIPEIEPGKLVKVSLGSALKVDLNQDPESTANLSVSIKHGDENVFATQKYDLDVYRELLHRVRSINGELNYSFLAGDHLSVAMNLVNPSTENLGAGWIWIESINAASFAPDENRVGFSDLFAQAEISLNERAFKIVSEVGSAQGLTMKLRWKTLKNVGGTFDVYLGQNH